MRRFIPRASTLLSTAVLLFATTRTSMAYTLEFMDKWGLSYFQTFGPVSFAPGGPSGATITWSYITEGVGFSDAQYGAGAFAAAVNNAFAAWASIANVHFVQVPDNGAPLPLLDGAYYNDIEDLMLHEIGHALGLGHSSDPTAVMCG